MLEKIENNPEIFIGLTLIISFLSMVFANVFILFFLFLWAFYFVNKHRQSFTAPEFKRAGLAGVIVLFFQPYLGILTFFAALASQFLFRGRVNASHFYNKDQPQELYKTLAIILLAGPLLGFLNLYLSGQWDLTHLPPITFQTFYFPIAMAVFEEIFFRNFLYSVYIYFLENKPLTSMQNFWLYFLMIIPPVMAHLHFSMGQAQVMQGMLILTLCFGLPLAFVLRKVNLLSAIGLHAMIVLVRSIVLGF